MNPDRGRKSRLPTPALFLLALGLFVFPILACEFSASTATITNAVLAKDVKGDTLDPVGITDSFQADQPKFHAVVSVSNAPKDTAVRAAWIAVDVGGAAKANTQIDQTELKVEGTRNVDFALPSDGSAWPAGSYKVDIYLDGKLNRSLNFTVVALPPTPTPTARPTSTRVPTSTVAPTAAPSVTPTTASVSRATATRTPSATFGDICPPVPQRATKASGLIKSVTLSRDSNPTTREPINPTTVFSPNSIFHAIVVFTNAPADTKLTATWFATDLGAPDCNEEILSTDYTASGSNNVDFSLTPKNDWPVGTYRVEIAVNDVVDTVFNFTVSASGSAPATRAPATATRAAIQPTTAPTRAPTAAPTAVPKSPTPAGITCGGKVLDPGNAGIVVINHFDGEMVMAILSHQYKIPAKSRFLVQVPGGTPFTWTITVTGVGTLTAGPVTLPPGACEEYEPTS